MTVEELTDQISHLDWVAFEITEQGDLTLGGITYRMRIGLYLNKPIQAIMVHDQFVRIKELPANHNYMLDKLEPSKAVSCLYRNRRITVRSSGIIKAGTLTWRPPFREFGL